MNQTKSWVKWLAIAPIPLLVLAQTALWVVDLQVTWHMWPVALFLYYGSLILGLLFIVIPAARSFLNSGELNVLLLGCGILVMDIAVLFHPLSFSRSASAAFAIYGISGVLSSICHFTGIAILSRRTVRLKSTAVWLTAVYASGAAAMALVILTVYAGWVPIVFTEGQGGTLLRTLVVCPALALFAVATVILWLANLRSASPFLFWYALGLALLTTGLTGSTLYKVVFSPLHWVSLCGQVVGTIYMCVAVFSTRKSKPQTIPLTKVADAWREGEFLERFKQQTPLTLTWRYVLTIALVAAATMLRLLFTRWVGSDLPPYIVFYPTVMLVALLVGLGPGLMATVLACLVTSWWILPTSSIVDRLGLAIFASMSCLMSMVAELYRYNRDKIADYERKAALHQSEERFRILFATMSEGFVLHESICDGTGKPCDYRFLEVNPAFERLTGWGRNNVIGRQLSEVLPHIRSDLMAAYHKTMFTGEPLQLESIFATPDRFYDLRGYRAGPSLLAVVFKDITERKRADEALQRSEQRLRRFYESGMIGVIYFDIDGGITDANDAFLRMVGYDRQELTDASLNWVHMTPAEYQHLDEAAINEIVASGGSTLPYEKVYISKDGTRIPILIAGAMLDEKRREGVAFVLDITERKRSEEELKKLNIALETANQAKNKFLATMSHDLRTPLNAVIGFSELLLMDNSADALEQKQRERVLPIADAGHHLLNLVEGLLNLSAIEAGKITLKKEMIDLKLMMEKLSTAYELLATQRNIVWLCDIKVNRHLFADKHRLWEVFNNLVNNALKYTPPMGSITLGIRETSREVAIFVKDTGTGIDKNDFERIFLPFERGKSPGVYNKGKSVGLGLAICRRLIELHDGRLTVESTKGEGSCFTVTLPYTVEEKPPEPSVDL